MFSNLLTDPEFTVFISLYVINCLFAFRQNLLFHLLFQFLPLLPAVGPCPFRCELVMATVELTSITGWGVSVQSSCKNLEIYQLPSSKFLKYRFRNHSYCYFQNYTTFYLLWGLKYLGASLKSSRLKMEAQVWTGFLNRGVSVSQPEAHLFLLKCVYFAHHILKNGRRIGKYCLFL